jgi:CBS domain-containing protein
MREPPAAAYFEAGVQIMLIREVMTRQVEFITPDETLQSAAVKMKELGVGPLPVCENAGVVGMLTDRDITVRAVAEGRNPKTTKVRDVMSGELICCFADQEVEVAAHLMCSQQIRRVLVLDRDKQLVGIVSLSDLALESASPERAGEILQDVCGGASQV